MILPCCNRDSWITGIEGWLLLAGLSVATLVAGCSPKSSADFLAAGDQAQQSAKFADAEADYQAAIKLAPNDARAHMVLGQLYALEKKRDLARNEFMKALELAPNNAVSHKALGDAYADASQLELAEEQYRAAVALDPANPGYRMALGSTLAKANKPGAAEGELRTAIGLEPKNAHAHLALATLLGTEPGGQDEAQAEMAEVRALDPGLVPTAPQKPAPEAATTIVPAAPDRAAAPANLRVLDRKFLLTHDSPVYAWADDNAQVVAQVHRKKFVHVTGMTDDWFRIQLRDGTVGYIPVTTAE